MATFQKSALFLFLVLIAIGGCRALTDANTTQDNTIDLLEREFILLEDSQTRLTFVTTLADSRCPSDAQCVVQGSTTIEMRLDNAVEHYVFELSGYVGPDGNDESNPVFVVVDGVKITLLKLSPYPLASAPSNDLYRATLRVEF